MLVPRTLSTAPHYESVGFKMGRPADYSLLNRQDIKFWRKANIFSCSDGLNNFQECSGVLGNIGHFHPSRRNELCTFSLIQLPAFETPSRHQKCQANYPWLILSQANG